ncbi:MAG: amidohydrolase family protein [Bryobacterales bacterium]|nr:amidohydrolase family protein [Bryobacterales bacterium]
MIDAHVHVWTSDAVRYPRAAGEREYKPAQFTPADLFVHAKPAGVSRAVLIQMSFYRYDNSYMLDAMRAHPGVFAGVGIVDSKGAQPGQAMRVLAAQGVRGFRVTAGTGLDSDAMWSTGAAEGLAMCALVGPESLPVIDRMCTKYPDTPVVIDHLARIGATGTVRDEDVRLLCGLAKHRRVSVKASAFYALGRKQAPYRDLAPLIRRVFEDYGPRRLMWASDCPFQVEGGHSYAASVALVRDGLPFLGNEDKEWILGKTAEQVFFAPKKG